MVVSLFRNKTRTADGTHGLNINQNLHALDLMTPRLVRVLSIAGPDGARPPKPAADIQQILEDRFDRGLMEVPSADLFVWGAVLDGSLRLEHLQAVPELAPWETCEYGRRRELGDMDEWCRRRPTGVCEKVRQRVVSLGGQTLTDDPFQCKSVVYCTRG